LKIYLQKVGRLKQFQKLAGERGWYVRKYADDLDELEIARWRKRQR
jgi:hypothetical protein